MTESEAKIDDIIETLLFFCGETMNQSDKENLSVAIDMVKEREQYRAIGTVSEFRELKEKATAIKALGARYSWDCPCCGTFHSTNGKYCSECGQAVELD